MDDPTPMRAAAASTVPKWPAKASSTSPQSVKVMPAASEYRFRTPVRVEPDRRLQQRSGQLIDQRDQADVPEIELKGGFQNRVIAGSSDCTMSFNKWQTLRAPSTGKAVWPYMVRTEEAVRTGCGNCRSSSCADRALVG